MKERNNRILSILSSSENRRIEVSKLSEILDVSQVTVRKDLEALSKTGIIVREHGCAILSDTSEVYPRLALHYDIKLKIARKAAELVKNGETLMLEMGSCCAIFADVLTETKKDLTIITNCAFTADYIRKKTPFQIILLGGIYQHESQTMVGPMVRECAANFFVKNLFIGAEGFADNFGVTGSDQMRAQAVKDMAKQAENIIVLADHTKYEKHGTVPLNFDGKKATIITDTDLDESKRKQIISSGYKLIIV